VDGFRKRPKANNLLFCRSSGVYPRDDKRSSIRREHEALFTGRPRSCGARYASRPRERSGRLLLDVGERIGRSIETGRQIRVSPRCVSASPTSSNRCGVSANCPHRNDSGPMRWRSKDAPRFGWCGRRRGRNQTPFNNVKRSSVNARRRIARVSNGRSRGGARHREYLVTVRATEEADIVHLPNAGDAQGAFTEWTQG